MRDYVILTDSCCDLSAEMAAELGVEVLPLSLQMGDRTYRNYLDGREIGFHEFYERVRSGELATTSAVNVGEFEEKMREILKTGKDILSISFSSALSTTYQSSVIAAEELKDEFPDAKILTVDSLCASLGQGLFVYLCAQEQKKGKTIDEVKTFAEETKGRVCHWFTVDDLNHLKRGGRINAATALFGTMLAIKPVMSVKANIIHLKDVPENFSVGYGRKFISKRPSKIATLALGYADGYPRPYSQFAKVLVNGCVAPVAGNICMDHVTDVPDVKIGDEVIIMGTDGKNTILADDIARATGTINYEIVCAFGQRLPKVYVK